MMKIAEMKASDWKGKKIRFNEQTPDNFWFGPTKEHKTATLTGNKRGDAFEFTTEPEDGTPGYMGACNPEYFDFEADEFEPGSEYKVVDDRKHQENKHFLHNSMVEFVAFDRFKQAIVKYRDPSERELVSILPAFVKLVPVKPKNAGEKFALVVRDYDANMFIVYGYGLYDSHDDAIEEFEMLYGPIRDNYNQFKIIPIDISDMTPISH